MTGDRFVCWCDGEVACTGTTPDEFGLCADCLTQGHRALPSPSEAGQRPTRRDPGKPSFGACSVWLVQNEPGRERAESEDAWLRAVTNRIKSQRWPEVCAAIEANPDLSATTIAERLGGKPVAPIPAVRPQPEPWTPPEPDGPALPHTAVRERIAELKAQLQSITKPPMETP